MGWFRMDVAVACVVVAACENGRIGADFGVGEHYGDFVCGCFAGGTAE